MARNVLELSKSPFKTQKSPNAADTVSAWLLQQAWYVRQEVAGVFNYLPLGVRVLNNIKKIISDNLDDAWAEEILMSWIGAKEHWEQTWRNDIDILYKLPSGADGKYNFLNPTHEEIVTPLMKEFLSSYRDLPAVVYQTQTKFRNEKRPKSGILRGREFMMNDAYSFHTSIEDLDITYERMQKVYQKIFKDLWLGDSTYLTYALGWTFSEYSHEFQTLTENWEDVIYVDKEKNIAVNKEVLETEAGREKFKDCNFVEHKACETWNIFRLWTKFTDAFWVKYLDEKGKQREVMMWCYGIWVSRVMGVIADKFFDEKGLVWPENVAPYDYYFITIGDKEIEEKKNEIIKKITKAGKSVIVDDRNISFWKKAKDADLLWIPQRIILSPKSQEMWGIEVKKRTEETGRIIQDVDELLSDT